MKTKIFLSLLTFLFALGLRAQEVTPGGTVPLYLLQNFTPLDTGEVGQLIGLVDYTDGDTLFSFLPVTYRNGKLLVNGDTLATVTDVAIVPGPYNSDFLAGQDNIEAGQMYYVGGGNIYDVEAGFVRVRLAVAAGTQWAGQDASGNVEYWADDVEGFWIGDDS